MTMLPKLKRIKLDREGWENLKKMVFDRDGWRCRLCPSTINLTADHIIKRSQSGDDALSNLWTLCANCHRRKDEYKLTPKEMCLVPIGTRNGGHPWAFWARATR